MKLIDSVALVFLRYGVTFVQSIDELSPVVSQFSNAFQYPIWSQSSRNNIRRLPRYRLCRSFTKVFKFIWKNSHFNEKNLFVGSWSETTIMHTTIFFFPQKFLWGNEIVPISIFSIFRVSGRRNIFLKLQLWIKLE